jgi:type III restriction enzyme
MQLKEYQEKALSTFDKYLGILREKLENAEKAKAALEVAKIPVPPQIMDYPTQAWEQCRNDGLLPPSAFRIGETGTVEPVLYTPRSDPTGRSVPSVCFKVPTGGGKTLMGVWGVSAMLQRFLFANRGIVLWIVPNEAIYAQTKKQLTNRDHPYRQALDRAAAGADRVRILEKDDPINAADVREQLCVMLVMLASANRETKEQLRMFRDRGNVAGFFPPEGDPISHFDLLKEIPNLDTYGDPQNLGALIKDSLGNVLRLSRPIIVLDEGHKAYSKLATQTLYGFNPSLVLELSATPAPGANRLVDVSGADLEREEMIKLPINVEVKAGVDWKKCLIAAWDKLEALQRAAEEFEANSSRYIRPILLLQVERTGKEQRDPKFVHALDAKDFLLTLGLADDEIAIKTAEVNDLRDPTNQDLLSPTNRIRAIITKRALQEGWDCPFAYVLCSLAASHNLSAMTQLVGRVLRQPDTKRTGVAALDECYVYCHHIDTASVIDGIKASLEADGMGDIAGKIQTASTKGLKAGARALKRRRGFDKARIFLPVVLWADRKTPREFDYEVDLLFHIDWNMADIDAIADGIAPDTHSALSQQVRLGLSVLTEIGRQELSTRELNDRLTFDPVHATRAVVDIVGNPWIARSLIAQLLARLVNRGFGKESIGRASGYVLDELRKGLVKEQDRMAEDLFRKYVDTSRVQFRLRTDSNNWELPDEILTSLPTTAKLLYRPTDGKPVERTLFVPMYEADFNTLEAEFACYIDEDAAVEWWFRNIARQSYGLQGWRKHRVYPDFIFASKKAKGGERLVVIETKGQFLANEDTEYKRELFDLLSAAYSFENVRKAGELQLLVDSKTTVVCDLVFGDDWKTQFHNRHLG